MRPEATPLNLKQPFTYIVPSGALAANASGSYTLILAQDSEFDLQAIVASTSQDTTPAAVTNNFSLLMRDVTGGRDYSTAPVPRFLLAGIVPQNVLNIGERIRFPRKQQIEFQFTNLTATANTITLALLGFKVFTRSI
jgi:hypothetical protein